MKETGAIRFETEGRNANCWVMPADSHTGTDEHDADKIIVRSNGTVTYAGKDIAYQLWKLGELGLDFYYKPFQQYVDGHVVWVTTSQPPTDEAMVANQPPPQARLIEQGVAASVTKFQEIGGLAGRVVLAWLAVVIVSRRKLIRMFQVPGLILMPIVFAWAARTDLDLLYPMMFLAGFFTVAQFSFWGNYLPRVYPVHLRGTGESFAANIGGRVIGTAAAWFTITLSEARPPDPAKIAIVGAVVAGLYALAGALLTQWLPEPGEKLTD